MSGRTAARIYCLIARQARRAVIFRRGPSKQVLLLNWDLATDQVIEGQWLKGRIYERRCDLSPDGTKLVYFAANQRPPIFSWTAVSTPPWLTARRFFPKGDCWGGGGLFDSNTLLRLNHGFNLPPDATPLDKKGRRIPQYMRGNKSSHLVLTSDGFNFPGLKVTGFGSTGGVGEDGPILVRRLERDGWTKSDTLPQGVSNNEKAQALFENNPPVVWTKASRFGNFALCFVSHGFHEKNGTWNIETAYLLGGDGRVSNYFGRIDWSDFDQNGDVLFAQSGRLYRLGSTAAAKGNLDESVEVADLNDLKFEERVAPY